MTDTPTVVYPDTLLAVKQWLAQHPLLRPLHGGRVFLATPDHPSGYPLIHLSYLSDAGSVGYTTIDAEVFTVECRGNVPIETRKSDYPQVRALAQAVRSAVYLLAPTPVGSVLLVSAQTVNRLDSPDLDDGSPRYVLDVRFVSSLIPAD